jgi:hypothetical protein
LPALTIFTIIITILLLVFAGDLGKYVLGNPWLLAVIPAWVATGLVWSLPRWFIFLRKGFSKFKEISKKYDLTTEDGRSKFILDYPYNQASREYGFVYGYKKAELVPPTAKRNTGRITSWVLLWPWSMVWTLIGDGLIELVKWFVELLSSIYQRMADYVYNIADSE